jgi:DNA-binding CsgD family transcriptional regulator
MRCNAAWSRPRSHQLTDREREVMRLRAIGHTNGYIASELGVSLGRVRQLANNAKRRLEHARAFSREKEFKALYQREQSLENLRQVARAFYILSTLLPPRT